MDRQRLDGVFRSAFFSKILKDQKNIDSLVVTNSFTNSSSIKLYKKLGLNNFFYINKEYYKFNNILFLFKTLFLTINFFISYNLLSKKKHLSKYKFKDILIGDLMIDQLIRYNKNDYLTKFNIIEILKIFFSTIFKLYILEKIIINYNIKYLITTSYSYLSISSLGIRVILKKKGKVIMIGGSSYQIFNNYNDCLTGFVSSSELNYKKVKSIIENKKKIKKANFYFKKRVNFKNKDKSKKLSPFDTEIYKAYSKKNFSKKNIYKILGLRNYKKPLCIFGLHAFRDANHLYGKLLFESYFDEFLQTINFLKNRNNFYWVFKIHPYSKRYGEEKIALNLIKKMKIKNIFILPDYISTKSILLAADKLVTSRGTIAIEYACLGKEPIVTASSYYSKYQFVKNTKNINEYFRNLLNPDYPKYITKKKIKTARAVLYIIKNLAANENNFNITRPEHEIGQNSFLREIETKFSILKNKNHLIYKKYLTIYNNI